MKEMKRKRKEEDVVSEEVVKRGKKGIGTRDGGNLMN